MIYLLAAYLLYTGMVNVHVLEENPELVARMQPLGSGALLVAVAAWMVVTVTLPISFLRDSLSR